MSALDKIAVISEIPIFASLSPKELKEVSGRSRIIEFKKGERIYEENSPASGFYCLAQGRVVIYTTAASGSRTVLEYLHRGKYFGIISLLTREAHSVTAEALNDCAILFISHEDFDSLINFIPRLAIDLSLTLSRRLKRKDVHQKTIFESTVISVFSSYSQAGKTMYALNLSLSLIKETRKSAIILDIASSGKSHSLPAKLGVQACPIANLSGTSATRIRPQDFIIKTTSGVDLACFHYEPDDEACVKAVLGTLSLLVNDYHYLILDLPVSMDRAIFSILNQSDLIQVLSGPDEVELKRTAALVQRLKDEFGFKADKIQVLINEYKFSKASAEEQSRIVGQPVYATLPKIPFAAPDRLVTECPDCEYSRAVRRVAREVSESMVGLVLGIGMGYGFCHIGVLRVLEEEKIPVDIVAGSSIGALIAALWAVGYSSREILDIIRQEFRQPKHIWNIVDFTFPRLGFIKGGKLYKFLKKYLKDKTFYDLKLPLKVIASDVKKKEPRIFDSGPLIDAVMASCAMPGVFTPFRLKGEMLFDGGVTNPLPTEALSRMGIKKIIAVNVTPSRQDILNQFSLLKENITTNIPQDIKKRKWYSLKEHIRESFRTNILDIIFSSVEILQSEVAEKEAQWADVVLHPDTSGLYWLELHRAAEFARRGEEEARRKLERIRQVVDE